MKPLMNPGNCWLDCAGTRRTVGIDAAVRPEPELLPYELLSLLLSLSKSVAIPDGGVDGGTECSDDEGGGPTGASAGVWLEFEEAKMQGTT